MAPASDRQLEVCSRIAERTGRTFTLPLSSRDAHRIISRDKAIRARRRTGLDDRVVADAFGIRAAIWEVAGLTAMSGLIVAVRMYETRGESGREGLAAIFSKNDL